MREVSSNSEIVSHAIVDGINNFVREVLIPRCAHLAEVWDGLRAKNQFPQYEVAATFAGKWAVTSINEATASEKVGEFSRLVAEWKSQSEFLSSTSAMVGLPAYQSIIAMGRAAVPLILDEMRREPDHWFVALSGSPAKTRCRRRLAGTSIG